MTTEVGAHSDYTFRFRIRVSRSGIAFTSARVLLQLDGLPAGLEITPRFSPDDVQKQTEFVFKASGFPSEEAARQAADALVADLKRTFARLNVGVDFGELSPKSMFFKAGLAMFEQDGGPRVLNDFPEIQVFESIPTRFVAMGPAIARVTQTQERFEKVLQAVRRRSRSLSRKEQLALELYSASFFQSEARARFLLLFMAVEALIQPEPRSARARWLIEGFIHQVRGDTTLRETERRTLEGGLVRLNDESIGSAGARMVRDRLQGTTYQEKAPDEFFALCNRFRGKLVHGKLTDKAATELGTLAANLERFVGALLASDLLDVEL